MRSLKTYEGFFDLFKSKPSADDEIALEYIARLKKVKGISPYKITYDPGNREGNNFEIDKWIVDFEDTPIKLWSVISLRGNGFDEQSQDLLISKKLARYSDKEFYGLNVICEGEPENCKAKPKILEQKDLSELSSAGISEQTKGMSIFEILGWLGSICLAICGLPQAWQSFKDKHSYGISWGFVLLWAFGEIFALAYVYDKLDLPLLLNYATNILILAVILYYKIKPQTTADYDKEVRRFH